MGMVGAGLIEPGWNCRVRQAREVRTTRRRDLLAEAQHRGDLPGGGPV